MSLTRSLGKATAIPVTQSSKAVRFLLSSGAAKARVGLQESTFTPYPLRLDPPPTGIDFTDLICARRALHSPPLVYSRPGSEAKPTFRSTPGTTKSFWKMRYAPAGRACDPTPHVKGAGDFCAVIVRGMAGNDAGRRLYQPHSPVSCPL